jgi:hypothetical protein
MEPCQIVLNLLLPPDEPPPKAVHPGVRALHDPASCPVARHLTFGLDLFPTAPDMGGIPPRLQRPAELAKELREEDSLTFQYLDAGLPAVRPSCGARHEGGWAKIPI